MDECAQGNILFVLLVVAPDKCTQHRMLYICDYSTGVECSQWTECPG
jgi:hypothetical protein